MLKDRIVKDKNGAYYFDEIAEYYVFGDSLEHVLGSLYEGYSTIYRGSCTGGYLELRHECSSETYHRYYCNNPLIPCQGHDWPRGTGDHIDDNGKPSGHVNDFWLELNDSRISFKGSDI